MRVIIQRVSSAQVTVNDKIIGQIGRGYLLLVGFESADNEERIAEMARKIYQLRINEDDSGKMNLSIDQVGGSILSVSQFTLYADCHLGNRPGFSLAAPASQASIWYDEFNEALRRYNLNVQTGQFQADMKVQLVNDGPVTIILDSTLWEETKNGTAH
jgi:D-tyrosyl-tRNA(Tyr) deacylase